VSKDCSTHHSHEHFNLVVSLCLSCRNFSLCLARTSPCVSHTAAHRNRLQHTATHCNTLRLSRIFPCVSHTAAHRNRLERIATHCNTLRFSRRSPCVSHTAAHCNALQHTATHCVFLGHLPVSSCVLGHRPVSPCAFPFSKRTCANAYFDSEKGRAKIYKDHRHVVHFK